MLIEMNVTKKTRVSRKSIVYSSQDDVIMNMTDLRVHS